MAKILKIRDKIYSVNQFEIKSKTYFNKREPNTNRKEENNMVIVL